MAAAFTLAGCNDQDDLQDRVDALGNRVTALEEQVKILNENLETLGTLLNMENMKTIKDVQTDNGQYTITLSDNTELSLTIGVQGTAQEPEITIDEDGEWVVNGKPMGVSAVGQAGANGSGYPEFRVNEGKWQVRFVDASGTPGDWQDVKGDANTGIGEIGDQIIAGVEVTDTQLTITYYTDYSEGTTETISLPIVPDLTCEIVTGDLLDDEDYLLMEAGTVQTLSVNISGGTPQLTYPSEWRATIESTDTEGVYELAIYAPDDDASAASAGSRVSANNMEDVTVRVQSGTYWAVDKVKVKIGSSEPPVPVEKTPYEKYEENGSITIGSLTLDATALADMTVAQVTSSNVSSISSALANNVNAVYFIDPDVTLMLPTSRLTVSNLILISNSSDGSRAKVQVQVDASGEVTATFLAGNSNVNFAVQNIEFVGNEVGPLMELNANSNLSNFILDGCKISVLGNRNLFNGHNGTNPVSNIELLNNDIRFDKNGNNAIAARVLNFAGSSTVEWARTVSGTVKLDNNVLYSTEANNGCLLTTYNSNDYAGEVSGTFTCTNNTIINFLTTSMGGLIRSRLTGSITFENCLFFDNVSTSGNCMLLRAVAGATNVPQTATFTNVKSYSNSGQDTGVNYRYWYTNNNDGAIVPSGYQQGTAEKLSANPFPNGIDWENGSFASNANCGATR